VSEEIVIICPELTAGSGGLADYTLRVMAEWRDVAPLRFLLPRGEKAPDSLMNAERVELVERNAAALLAALPNAGGKVLLQYSAYGFDRFGYPRWLLRTLADWKEQSGGLLVVMLHEIWTFWPVLNKNYVVQQLHRRDIRALMRSADAIFTSTASQAEHLRGLEPECAVEVLPVGSNIEPVPSATSDRDPGVAVLFGLEGSRVRALKSMHSDLEALGTRGVIRRIITAGADSGEQERRLLAELPLVDGFEQRGALPDREISELLLRGSFGISAQDELSLTKSGTFMAYAAHGLNIISPHGDRAKPEPLCWLTRPGELLAGVDDAELERRAESLREWQRRTASWPQIAKQFARALQLVDPEQAVIS
jgi:hypothetical protein